MRNERDFIGRWVAGLGLAALLSALAACAASPPVHFHSLMPIDTPVRTHASEAPVAVIVEPVRVPAQVDQPQWLIRMADGSVARLEQERWASPLRDELRGAVREWLVDRYGAVEATTPAASAAAVRIATELRRFESIPSSEARLEGSWALLAGGAAGTPGTSISCELLIREPVSGPGYAALAAAQRRAVERLADAIGPSLRSFSSRRVRELSREGCRAPVTSSARSRPADRDLVLHQLRATRADGDVLCIVSLERRAREA